MRPADVIGRNRRERLLSLGTVAFILVAIAAFIALDTPDADSPEKGVDRALLALDRKCVETKRRLRDDTAGKVIDRSTAPLMRSIRSLRVQLRSAQTDSDDQMRSISGAEGLDSSLGDLRAAILDLDTAIASGQTADAQAAIAATNVAAAEVDRWVEGMNLERCSNIRLAPG